MLPMSGVFDRTLANYIQLPTAAIPGNAIGWMPCYWQLSPGHSIRALLAFLVRCTSNAYRISLSFGQGHLPGGQNYALSSECSWRFSWEAIGDRYTLGILAKLLGPKRKKELAFHANPVFSVPRNVGRQSSGERRGLTIGSDRRRAAVEGLLGDRHSPKVVVPSWLALKAFCFCRPNSDGSRGDSQPTFLALPQSRT